MLKLKNHYVAVLGASRNPKRYANRALRMLVSHGYYVVPVNSVHKEIEGITTVSRLTEVTETIDTLTIYVGPQHIKPLIDDIISLRPGRVILNPGTESFDLESVLSQCNIHTLKACTLVLLATGQFV